MAKGVRFIICAALFRAAATLRRCLARTPGAGSLGLWRAVRNCVLQTAISDFVNNLVFLRVASPAVGGWRAVGWIYFDLLCASRVTRRVTRDECRVTGSRQTVWTFRAWRAWRSWLYWSRAEQALGVPFAGRAEREIGVFAVRRIHHAGG